MLGPLMPRGFFLTNLATLDDAVNLNVAESYTMSDSVLKIGRSHQLAYGMASMELATPVTHMLHIFVLVIRLSDLNAEILISLNRPCGSTSLAEGSICSGVKPQIFETILDSLYINNWELFNTCE